MIDMHKEPAFHLAPILSQRPLAAVGARIKRDDCQSHVQVTARQRMIVFAIKASIGERCVDWEMSRRSFQQRFPQHTFIRWPTTRSRREDEVRMRVAGNRQLRPETLLEVLILRPSQVMPARMAFFKAGRINRNTQSILEATLLYMPEPVSRREARRNAYRCAARFGRGWSSVEYGADRANSRRQGSPLRTQRGRGNRSSIVLEVPAMRKVERA